MHTDACMHTFAQAYLHRIYVIDAHHTHTYICIYMFEHQRIYTQYDTHINNLYMRTHTTPVNHNYREIGSRTTRH